MVARRDAVRGALVVGGAAIAIALGASCASIIGLEPYRSSGGGGASASSGHGGATTSANGGSAESANGGAAGGMRIDGGHCAGECLASPSAKFKGPVLLEDGTTCPSGKPLVTGMLAPTECRECSCAPSSECTMSFASTVMTPAGCTSSGNTLIEVPAGCAMVTPWATPLVEASVEATEITCVADPGCIPPTPSTFSLCTIGEACKRGDTCVPPHARVCFYGDEQSGSCPDGFDVIDEMLAADIKVSGCACSLKPTGYNCQPLALGFSQEPLCADEPNNVDVGTCVKPQPGSVYYQPLVAPMCLAPAPQTEASPPYTHVCCGP